MIECEDRLKSVFKWEIVKAKVNNCNIQREVGENKKKKINEAANSHAFFDKKAEVGAKPFEFQATAFNNGAPKLNWSGAHNV